MARVNYQIIFGRLIPKPPQDAGSDLRPDARARRNRLFLYTL